MARQDGPILLFANGVLDDTGWVGPYLARAAAVIAADGGLRHLLPLGHRPDALIGDLDSLPAGVVAEEAAGRVIRHPRDKDETDLELALLYAVAQYPGHEVFILGGFGGRLDHMLANILVLAHPRLLGQPIRFVDDRESAWLLAADPPGETTVHGAPGDIVSLLPLGGPAHVLATTGLRWPLHNETLLFGPARGVSNEMTAAVATVRLGTGVVVCVHVGQ
ncbi:MAG: thiamine diphosphokinase [Candidatus Promineofilum sp.]|nr:thiamine diphosphokinase [Promineifilum sp.]